MSEWFKKVIRKILFRITSPIHSKTLARIVFFFINAFATGRSPKDSLVFLLELERHLFSLVGTESCRYGQGIHTKHKHTRYHNFFTQKIRPGEKVLDIGCGNGALSFDLARAGAVVSGVDNDLTAFAFAQKNFSHPGLRFILGDALKDLPEGSQETIILSNVLEHIEDRIGFIRKLQKRYHPSRWLIRVPLYERDWRVPLMEEVGVDYRLDERHYIEYSQESFIEELTQAGLILLFLEIRWGEIWCEAGQQREVPLIGKNLCRKEPE